MCNPLFSDVSLEYLPGFLWSVEEEATTAVNSFISMMNVVIIVIAIALVVIVVAFVVVVIAFVVVIIAFVVDISIGGGNYFLFPVSCSPFGLQCLEG